MYKNVLTNGGSQMAIMKNNVLKLKYVIHNIIMFTKIIMNVWLNQLVMDSSINTTNKFMDVLINQIVMMLSIIIMSN